MGVLEAVEGKRLGLDGGVGPECKRDSSSHEGWRKERRMVQIQVHSQNGESGGAIIMK